MSDTTITESGLPIPAESYVTPDGLTIKGAGVDQSPITTDGGLDTLGRFADLFTASAFLSGTPVYPLLYDAGTGLTELATGLASTAASSGVIGLVVNDAGLPYNGGLYLATGGVLELTTAQWDAVVQGESGGLVVGQTYYLNSNGGQKPITTTQPTSDQYVGLGTAFSPTKMSLKITTPNDSGGG